MSNGATLQEAHLIGSIHKLFGNDERLVEFFFHHKYRRPRLLSEALLVEAEALLPSEWVLMKVALDLWDGSGGTALNEMIRILDDESLLAVVQTILHFREVSLESVEWGDRC